MVLRHPASRSIHLACSWLACGGVATGLLFAPGVAESAPVAAKTCAPEVIGTWRKEASSEPETTLLRFGKDGWVNLLSGPAERPAESFEILAQVSYGLVPARATKRLEFTTRRGNDVFASGKSYWDITAYTDQSLTTQPADAVGGEQTLWSRIQTQRHFLTLATRSAIAQKPAATVVMWTTLAAKMELEAVGMTGTGSDARLGMIAEEVAKDFMRQGRRSEDVMLRIELNEAEYLRTHRVLEAWDAVLRRDLLARNDPAGQMNELLEATLQSVNRCAPRLQLPTPPVNSSAASATSGTSVQQPPPQRIRELRKLNDKRHLSDKLFPFGWKQPAVG